MDICTRSTRRCDVERDAQSFDNFRTTTVCADEIFAAYVVLRAGDEITEVRGDAFGILLEGEELSVETACCASRCRVGDEERFE